MLYATLCNKCEVLIYTKKKTQFFCVSCSEKYRALMGDINWIGAPLHDYLADEEDNK